MGEKFQYFAIVGIIILTITSTNFVATKNDISSLRADVSEKYVLKSELEKKLDSMAEDIKEIRQALSQTKERN